MTEDWKEKFINKQVCGDNLQLLKEIPDNTVHLTVTSPPYNVDIPYDNYRDTKDYQSYLDFLEERFKQIYRVTVQGGKVAINVADAGKPIHSDITQFMTKELKFKHIATVLWCKGGRSNSPIFGSYGPEVPLFAYPYEFIVVFMKGNKHRRVGKNKKGITITKEQYLKYSNCLWEFPQKYDAELLDILKSEYVDYATVLFDFPPEHGMKKFDHPAMFPPELPRRFIEMLTFENDIVLDLFGGVGTTASVAKKLNRNFISMDLSQKYCDMANERIGLNQMLIDDF